MCVYVYKYFFACIQGFMEMSGGIEKLYKDVDSVVCKTSLLEVLSDVVKGEWTVAMCYPAILHRMCCGEQCLVMEFRALEAFHVFFVLAQLFFIELFGAGAFSVGISTLSTLTRNPEP